MRSLFPVVVFSPNSCAFYFKKFLITLPVDCQITGRKILEWITLVFEGYSCFTVYITQNNTQESKYPGNWNFHQNLDNLISTCISSCFSLRLPIMWVKFTFVLDPPEIYYTVTPYLSLDVWSLCHMHQRSNLSYHLLFPRFNIIEIMPTGT